ncbi:MAG: FkbM family methyltransferase [Gemmatimonadales bacterium]
MQLPYPIRDLGQRALGGVRVRIRSGANRGLAWSLAALGRGYGSGRFGRDRIEALACVTRPGDVFWDIGAHKGFVTLAASRRVGPSGTVVAVEPARVNRHFLERHLRWNRVANVRVIAAALSDHEGVSPFGGHGSSVAFRLGHGPEEVTVRTLAALASDLALERRPSVLKIDVEGGEARVLRGAGPLLGGDQAVLISTHGREVYEECRAILEERDFRIFDSWEIAERRTEPTRPWSSDHDVLAIGAERELDEAAIGRLRLVRGPTRK